MANDDCWKITKQTGIKFEAIAEDSCYFDAGIENGSLSVYTGAWGGDEGCLIFLPLPIAQAFSAWLQRVLAKDSDHG